MSAPNIRSALAEHLVAYADVTSSAARRWATQLARRVVAFVMVAALALLTLVVGIFLAILSSWNTPYRWWVAGGILVICMLGIVAGLVAAARALRTQIAPPWTILADEIATDLRGLRQPPVTALDDEATQRLQQSRERLHARFAGAVGAGGGAKVGLGVAALILMTLLKRRSSIGGLGMILPLAFAALKFWRRRK